MTSDAKVGLLLGLVFIFIIAFIINGLPTFRNDKNNNELTTTMVSSPNKTPGIGNIPREVIKQTLVKERALDEVQPAPFDEVQPAPIDNQVRFTIPLSDITTVITEIDEGEQVVPANPQPPVKKKESDRVEPSKPAWPKTYIVAAGDNLTTIAKKFYGAGEGNIIANITRIFQANHELMKSPDRIYEGQEIVIPALPASHQNNDKTGNIFAGAVFEKVKSIGRKHFSNGGSKAEQTRQYVVQEGDSLWRIAAKQLGDGSRYKEIAKLNAGVLDDEDFVPVGMRLKMPAQ